MIFLYRQLGRVVHTRWLVCGSHWSSISMKTNVVRLSLTALQGQQHLHQHLRLLLHLGHNDDLSWYCSLQQDSSGGQYHMLEV